jgi:hypothetical protein
VTGTSNVSRGSFRAARAPGAKRPGRVRAVHGLRLGVCMRSNTQHCPRKMFPLKHICIFECVILTYKL